MVVFHDKIKQAEFDCSLNSHSLEYQQSVQRSIYLVDILNRFVVCSISWLKSLSLDELRWLFYSKAPEY